MKLEISDQILGTKLLSEMGKYNLLVRTDGLLTQKPKLFMLLPASQNLN